MREKYLGGDSKTAAQQST